MVLVCHWRAIRYFIDLKNSMYYYCNEPVKHILNVCSEGTEESLYGLCFVTKESTSVDDRIEALQLSAVNLVLLGILELYSISRDNQPDYAAVRQPGAVIDVLLRVESWKSYEHAAYFLKRSQAYSENDFDAAVVNGIIEIECSSMT